MHFLGTSRRLLPVAAWIVHRPGTERGQRRPQALAIVAWDSAQKRLDCALWHVEDLGRGQPPSLAAETARSSFGTAADRWPSSPHPRIANCSAC